MRDAGCQVVELSPEEKARFQEAVTSMYGEYCAEYMDMIDAIAAAGK